VRRPVIDTRDIALGIRMHPFQLQMPRHTKDPEALEQHEGGTRQNADPRDVSEQEYAGAAEHLPVAVKGAAGTYPVQSVAISGNQWQSVAISAGTYPVQSVAISGNQLQSVAIRGNQRRNVSCAISCNPWQSVAISGNQRQSVAISAGTYTAVRDRVGAQRCHQEYSGALSGNQCSSPAVRDRVGELRHR